MTAITCDESHRRRTAAGPGGSRRRCWALCAATVLAGASPDPASAATASLIGKTKKTPRPDCPTASKRATRSPAPARRSGRVTGLPGSSAARARSPSDDPARRQRSSRGASTCRRPKPSSAEFFGKFYKADQFGTKPTARIAVLQRTKKGNSYKLKGQGPAVELTEHLGTKPMFTLGRSDPGEEGRRPRAHGSRPGSRTSPPCCRRARTLAREPVRRSMRRQQRGPRGKDESAEEQAADEDRASTRPYGCRYQQARLLYWGYYVRGLASPAPSLGIVPRSDARSSDISGCARPRRGARRLSTADPEAGLRRSRERRGADAR